MSVIRSQFDNLKSNISKNLNTGSKQSPLISEIRNVTEGVKDKNFVKAAVNSGYIGMCFSNLIP